MKILGINKRHFYIYFTFFMLSLISLCCIFLENEKIRVFFVSIGASGMASSLLGYFIELSNEENNKKIRRRNLARLVVSYKNTLERYCFYIFKVLIEVFKDKPKDKLYKVKIANLKQNLNILLKDHDNIQNFSLKDISKSDDYYEYEKAFALAKNIYISLKSLSTQITNITTQDLFGLLNYYSEDEITLLKETAEFFEGDEPGDLEDYCQILNVLTNNDFCKILGIYNIDDLLYYFKNENNKSALFVGNQIWSSPYRFKDIDIEKAVDFFE